MMVTILWVEEFKQSMKIKMVKYDAEIFLVTTHHSIMKWQLIEVSCASYL